ncbi:Heat Shock transcription factor [Ectocarpus siliculosus]|uniref:Heat Shock transcription factor n=1 Tax=Ectocarpus siliculosus TaxID=2880 RepID=D7G1S2_ECTSI|nr:Heat Shock transcription factor [Ectocarpus siliculosus]|eukprot:CBJ33317.1 Heat Shock transcription factor [Ectocarpus siliculosus]
MTIQLLTSVSPRSFLLSCSVHLSPPLFFLFVLLSSKHWQVLVFEGLLPSYYNHKKFLSFVRQLNFYGFKKVKGGASTRSRSSAADSQGEAGAGSTGARESDSWEEFRHPQFRRGRRDLLVGIKRQKDGGRLKRKRDDEVERSE